MPLRALQPRCDGRCAHRRDVRLCMSEFKLDFDQRSGREWVRTDVVPVRKVRAPCEGSAPAANVSTRRASVTERNLAHSSTCDQCAVNGSIGSATSVARAGDAGRRAHRGTAHAGTLGMALLTPPASCAARASSSQTDAPAAGEGAARSPQLPSTAGANLAFVRPAAVSHAGDI
jgi:hypothetical protein